MLTAPHRPAPGSHTAPSGPSVWRHIDVVLIVTVIVIAAFGSLMVYSSTRVALEANGVSGTYYLKKQVVFVAVGIVAMLVVAQIDYRQWRTWSPILYGLCLVSLLAVFKLGQTVNGAQAWFQIGSYQLEPSEFAKLALILALAAYASRKEGRLPGRSLLVILILAAIPFVLIFKQPDLGTALVISAVLIAVVTIAGVRLWQLALLALIAIVGVVGLVELGVLHKYQTERITAFIHTPNSVSSQFLEQKNEAATSEFNVVQSKDAISDGGLFGTGLFNGKSTDEGLVPEQHTDFIFSAVGEQVGLVGCAVLLILFLIVMWRTWQASLLARDTFGTLVAVGVLAMLLFQVFENIGMTMGIMPVAGIPLPWMSYGGSAIIVEFIAVGLVLSIRMRRF